MEHRIANTTNRADRILLKEYIASIYKKARYIDTVDGHGKFLDRWEEEISDRFGLNDTLFTNSGTDALQLAILLLRLRKNDEVIIPAVTYLSVALAVYYAGAKPILVDISEEDMLMDLDKLKQSISPATKAIIAIHMFGHALRMDDIMATAKAHGLSVIENVCQALGTTYRGRLTGGFGHLGAMSFRYAKTVSSFSGNGGALLLPDAKYKKEEIKADFMEIFKGKNGLFKLSGKIPSISFLDALTAMVKLKHLDEIAAKKKICRQTYAKGLGGMPEVRLFPDKEGSDSVRPFYFVLAARRDDLIKYLYRKGIECEPAYPPLSDFPQLGKFKKRSFPVAYRQWAQGIRLPLFPYMEAEESESVIREIKNFYAKNK